MSGAGSAHAIEVSGLTHTYGTTRAVDDLTLHVAAGEVVALLGHNGAGKSTTLRCLLGLQRAERGTCRVLGLDAWTSGVEVRRRVGYMPEDVELYGWMTVRETLWFVSQFHPTWDAALEARAARDLELPLERKVRELSRGMRAKLALLCATAFHPEALLLDDPTSGLDAVVRREILAHVIDLAAEGGRAVLFSSHVLDDVERLADRVAILVAGRKVLDRRVDALKSAFRRVTATFPHEAAAPVEVPGALSATRAGRVACFIVDGWAPEGETALRSAGASDVQVAEMPLEDIFVEVVRSTPRVEVSA